MRPLPRAAPDRRPYHRADRDKDTLKVGGENVAVSEIERVIALGPGVYEAAVVVGQRNRMLDEVR
jgi:crotonobetaine/carnitine-CoA ligase